MNLEIDKEYEWDGQYVKLIRLEGDEAVCETRFASIFRTDKSSLSEKPAPRKPPVGRRSLADDIKPVDHGLDYDYPFGRQC